MHKSKSLGKALRFFRGRRGALLGGGVVGWGEQWGGRRVCGGVAAGPSVQSVTGSGEKPRLGTSSHITLFLVAGNPVLVPDCWKVRVRVLP